jgi:hypothetical protein
MDGYPIPVWNVGEREETVHSSSPSPGNSDSAPKAAGAARNVPLDDDEFVSMEEIAAGGVAAEDDDPQSLLLQAAAQQVLWAKFYPNSISPGQIGEFAAKLRYPLKQAAKLDFILDTGEEISQLVRPDEELVALSAITFSEDLGTLYVYIESRGDAPQDIVSIEVDGRDVTASARLTSRTLAPAERQLAVIPLSSPLSPTSYVVVKATTSRASTQERVKAFHGFFIHLEDADDGIGLASASLDKYPFSYRAFPSFDENCGFANPPSQARAAYLFLHLNHICGRDWTRAARVALKRYDICMAARPELAAFNYLCRNNPLYAFPRFAELADALEVVPSYSSDPLDMERPLPWQRASRTLENARLAAAPKPVFAVLSNQKFAASKALATREEFRRRAYAYLAQAPKAIHYRWKDPKDAEAAVRAMEIEARDFNQCLAPVREYLAIAETLPGAAEVLTEDAPVSAGLLLAGDRAVLLVLISTQALVTEQPRPALPDSVTIALSLPGSLSTREFDSVLHLTPGGPVSVSGACLAPARTLTLPVPALAEAYLLALSAREEGRQ